LGLKLKRGIVEEERRRASNSWAKTKAQISEGAEGQIEPDIRENEGHNDLRGWQSHMTERSCIRRIRNQKGESGKEESRNADIGRANSNKCDGGNNSMSEMRQEQSPEEEEASSQNTAYA